MGADAVITQKIGIILNLVVGVTSLGLTLFRGFRMSTRVPPDPTVHPLTFESRRPNVRGQKQSDEDKAIQSARFYFNGPARWTMGAWSLAWLLLVVLYTSKLCCEVPFWAQVAIGDAVTLLLVVSAMTLMYGWDEGAGTGLCVLWLAVGTVMIIAMHLGAAGLASLLPSTDWTDITRITSASLATAAPLLVGVALLFRYSARLALILSVVYAVFQPFAYLTVLSEYSGSTVEIETQVPPGVQDDKAWMEEHCQRGDHGGSLQFTLDHETRIVKIRMDRGDRNSMLSSGLLQKGIDWIAENVGVVPAAEATLQLFSGQFILAVLAIIKALFLAEALFAVDKVPVYSSYVVSQVSSVYPVASMAGIETPFSHLVLRAIAALSALSVFWLLGWNMLVSLTISILLFFAKPLFKIMGRFVSSLRP